LGLSIYKIAVIGELRKTLLNHKKIIFSLKSGGEKNK